MFNPILLISFLKNLYPALNCPFLSGIKNQEPSSLSILTEIVPLAEVASLLCTPPDKHIIQGVFISFSLSLSLRKPPFSYLQSFLQPCSIPQLRRNLQVRLTSASLTSASSGG
ncbi:hypothetical protein CsSME_00016919 [Camellia sinensis var. sinensis]